ncbi:MAG: DegT/DnrJ/EryC1/StrS family aminotransferase [Alphaproteobacteria bacterium]|nr:DegT/DnrJ/EryC1/StrS family aminotransferase [Alphaproteobacteria bacterium]
MITTAPLPRWGDLASFPFAAGLPDHVLGAPWRGDAGGTVWFSRGALALGIVARWWEESHRRLPRVWVPDFFCEQSLGPLRRVGAEIVFYPIAPDLRPKWDVCHVWARTAPPDLFLLVHYFGIPGDLAPAREFRDEFGTILVEDGAHALRPATGIGAVGDFVLYSPHKLLAVPDGSVLVVENAGVAGEIAALAERLPRVAPRSGGWLLRRLAQKSLPGTLMSRIRPTGQTPFEQDPPARDQPEAPHLSPIARRLLGRLLDRLGAIARHRRHADRAVRAALSALSRWSPVATGWGEAAPYRTVMRCAEPGVAAERFAAIRGRGGVVESWPDLPPEVRNNAELHADAIRLRRTLLLFALDNAQDPAAQAAAWAARVGR